MLDKTTVSISSARSVIHYLTEQGYDCSSIIQQSGLTQAQLNDQEARLNLKDYHKLWDLALACTSDPAIGLHVGEQSNAHLMGLVANVLVHSDTLEQGIEQYVRLYSLVNEGIELTFDKQGAISVLEFHHRHPEFYCKHDMERTLVIAVQRTKQYVNDEIRMEQINIAHPEPEYIDEYQRLLGCKINFNQPLTSIEFQSKFLHFNPKQKNPYVKSALQNYAEGISNTLFKRNIEDKAKAIIMELLPHGQADIDHVAQHLHMSRQTLYRKLKKEGVVFQEMIEEIRQKQALKMIEDDHLSLSEIAFVLGFSELSAFSRAFKRWTGESPKRYRQNKS